MGSFKLRLDLTNLDKYLTYGFDGQIISGINNTNLIMLCYIMYKDSLMKCCSRCLITIFIFSSKFVLVNSVHHNFIFFRYSFFKKAYLAALAMSVDMFWRSL